MQRRLGCDCLAVQLTCGTSLNSTATIGHFRKFSGSNCLL